ncbi:unnamed protein product [Dibothriocephalus latus]|uniref:Uncharacterized protein n=1 Tax=Dibothriocephalus latus TaxID=60516 RepID=A0A3P7NWK9_DIBLA|nr:unnamed protein product [Dibothriocephalus latus]
MDEENFAPTANSPQLHEICRVGVLLNSTVPTIRQRLARENAFKKVPSLTFIHHSQSSILEGLKEGKCESSETDSLPVTPTMIKPSNVYGLPWDKYMACVKKEMRGGFGADLVEFLLREWRTRDMIHPPPPPPPHHHHHHHHHHLTAMITIVISVLFQNL